jgi:hypothetical protein
MLFAPEEQNICRNGNQKINRTPSGVLYIMDCVFVTIYNCILKVYTEFKQIKLMPMLLGGDKGVGHMYIRMNI